VPQSYLEVPGRGGHAEPPRLVNLKKLEHRELRGVIQRPYGSVKKDVGQTHDGPVSLSSGREPRNLADTRY
jgi:hypothetical protein